MKNICVNIEFLNERIQAVTHELIPFRVQFEFVHMVLRYKNVSVQIVHDVSFVVAVMWKFSIVSY